MRAVFAYCLFFLLLLNGLASAHAENLLPNGSFEVGHWGWSPARTVESSIEKGGAFEGDYFLRLKSKVQSQYAPLKPGTRYTVSFSARLQAPNCSVVVTAVSLSEKVLGRYTFPLIDQWRRLSFEIVVGALENGPCLINFEPLGSLAAISIDAVAIQKGSLVGYRPSEAELACYTSGYAYKKGDMVDFKTRFVQEGDRGYVVEYSLEDYWDKPVEVSKGGEILKGLKRWEGSHSWTADRTGLFRMEVRLWDPEGNRKASAETVFAVLPEPNKSDGKESPFGGHFFIEPYFLERAQKIGFNWIRLHDLSPITGWFETEPEKGRFRWHDAEVKTVASYGINILGMIEKPPYWASSAHPDKNKSIFEFQGYPPQNLSEFHDYVFRLVSHYKNYIKYWEVWNEPYNKEFWNGTKEQFVQMMKVAYEAAKEADPDCVVVAPAGRLEFIRDIFALGAYKYLDVLSYHQYFANNAFYNKFETEIEMIRGFKSLMQHYGVKKPIWNTEGGLIVRSFYRSLVDPGRKRTVDSREAAELMVKWYTWNLSEGVNKCFYYYMREDGAGYFDQRNSYDSLLEYDGKMKSHGVSLAIFTHVLGTSAKFVGKVDIKLPTGVLYAFVFDRGGDGVMTVLWAEGGTGPVRVSLPASDFRACDLMGNPIGRGTGNRIWIPAQKEPVYLIAEKAISKDEVIKRLSEIKDFESF